MIKRTGLILKKPICKNNEKKGSNAVLKEAFYKKIMLKESINPCCINRSGIIL
jgi:hypothetical protein